MFIKGKVILISRAASGIGLAYAEEFLKNGCLGITIVDWNEEKGNVAKDDLNIKYGAGKVIFIKANVASKSELEEAFKEAVNTFKQLDVVFNNAAVIDELNYQRCIDVNITGCLHGLKLAIDEYLPKYKSTSQSAVINTASTGGLVSWPGAEIYCATKSTIIKLTRNFGNDFHFKRSGVRVLGICPGLTATPLVGEFWKGIVYKESTPTLEEGFSKGLQTPEELAKCVVKILENGANGSTWMINLQGKETQIEIWVAMSRRRIIGPIFFYDTVNGVRYRQILEIFIEQLHDDELQYGFFQQDKAPAHTAKETLQYLEEYFVDRTISKDLWPPRSPDLTPLDFYLFGCLKNKIFKNRPQDLQQLERAIQEEINIITAEYLEIYREE